MCFNTTPALPNSQKKLGADNVGYIVMPRSARARWPASPITDTQGFGIPTKAKDHGQRREAHRLHALARSACRRCGRLSKQVPADTTFDAQRDRRPARSRTVYDKWVAGKHNVYIADLMPTLFWTDAMFVASQKILAGSMTGKRGGRPRRRA